jgi:hypothetical protein
MRALGGMVGRLRRVGLIAATACGIATAGCYGATAVDDDADRLTDADVGTGGDGDIAGDADQSTTGDAGDAGDAATPRREIEWCEPDHRLGGEAGRPMGFFVCGEEMPADVATYTAPQWLMDGALCGEETAWSRVTVREPFLAQVTFPDGSQNTSLTVRAPDGEVAVELGPAQPCALFEVEEGTWTLEARPTDPSGETDQAFAIAFDVPIPWDY